jgi:competence protein ComEC
MPFLGSICTALVVCGIATGLLTSVRSGDALGAAVALAALALLIQPRRVRMTLVFCALGTAAMAHGATARDQALAPEMVRWFDASAQATAGGPREVVYIEGILLADAVDTGSGVRLDVEAIRPARGRVQLHVAGRFAPSAIGNWTAGRIIRAPATLKRPQALVNFGGPSPRWQMMRRPFGLVGSIKSAALVEVAPGRMLDEAGAAARNLVRNRIGRTVGPAHPQAAALILAVLIGDRAALDDELVRKLQAAGTYHVIAISGGNVALLVAISVAILRWVTRSATVLAALCMGAVAAYGWIVSGEPSVTRAITVAVLYLASGLIGLAPRPLAILRTAAMLIVIAQPLDVLDAGAWLSFGATLGIITIAPRLVSVVHAGLGQRLSVVPRTGVLMIGATLAAELVILPVSASVFGRISVAGVPLNLVAIPAMALLQITGLLLVALAPMAPVLTPAFVFVATAAADALTGSSDLAEAWPWLSWRVPPVAVWWVAGYYALLLAMFTAPARELRRIATVAFALIASVICTAPFASLSMPHEGRVRVTVLDVGQGDAVLVQTPGRQSLLVDTGGSSGAFDIGSRIIAPASWALGVRRLTWLALTHGDRDHAGGAPSVTRDLMPSEIWEGVPVPRDPDRAALRDLAVAQGVAWRTIASGARLEAGAVRIDALHPPVPEWERQRVRNDDSLVLRVRFGQVELWLTGDAGAEFESRLAADATDAAIRVLKVGHHGSRSSTSAVLVNALRPQIAVVSVGAGNLFGHPAPAVMDRLAAAGATIFRTDRDGAVAIETDGETVYVQSASGRTWVLSHPSPPAPSPPATPLRAR